MPGIVVGVDGSPNSELALEWAMSEAALRGAALTVVAVHQAVVSHATGNPVSFPEDIPEVRQARRSAEAAVEKVANQMGEARPTAVTVQAVSGLPAKYLIDASHGADMVVVGSRGGGGFQRLMLGSVSSQVAHHAACPVVVVPHPR